MSLAAGPDPAAIQKLITAWAHQQGNYKFQTASYALYCWDHFFDDEVEKIWRRKFTFASLLYVLNRYITHAQFIAIQVGFYETTWSSEQCDRFVKFPGAGTVTVFGIAEMTMILRMYALYGRSNWVLYFLSIVLVTQVTIMGICLGTGVRVEFPPGFPGCVLTGTVSYFGAFWIAPLVTDSCIFTLTLFRTWRYRKSRITIAEQILRDGILYFLVIFCGNLLNVILYWSAPPDLTALGASFTHVMTSLMVARLHLNLRSALSANEGAYHASHSSVGNGIGRMPQRQLYAGNLSFFTLGNLGEEVEANSNSSANYGIGGKEHHDRNWGRPHRRNASHQGFDIPLQTLQPRARIEIPV